MSEKIVDLLRRWHEFMVADHVPEEVTYDMRDENMVVVAIHNKEVPREKVLSITNHTDGYSTIVTEKHKFNACYLVTYNEHSRDIDATALQLTQRVNVNFRYY